MVICYLNLQLVKTICFQVELIIKTTSQDGLLMLIKSDDAFANLILSIEPRRVQLHLIIQEGALDVFEVIEPHVGSWILVKVDYAPDMTYGLTVNGKRRKIIKLFNKKGGLQCSDNILIGDIAKEVMASLGKKLLKSLNYISLDGILAYVRVDDNIIDIETLPAEVEKGNLPFSSETVSVSSKYKPLK